jgi:hypothetical protein
MLITSLGSCNGGRRDDPDAVEVAFILGQDRMQVPLTIDQQVIKALAA